MSGDTLRDTTPGSLPDTMAVAAPPPAPDYPVVGIGASAGGLHACRALLRALATGHGMAFILVQHLDPTHESLLASLLTEDTAMTVRQATDGMLVEPDHLYLIPPGASLAVAGGALRVSPLPARHGVRLPVNLLLHALALSYGARAVCVILSGTGADGSLGLQAVKDNGGLVIAQDPAEAQFAGMPRSAILTDKVDLVLPAAGIAGALIRRAAGAATVPSPDGADHQPQDWLASVIALLRMENHHDFSLYKPGTLRRRIERRMAMAALAQGDAASYLTILRRDPNEREALAKDLLINVTSFFRDPEVFELLDTTIIPDLVRSRLPDQTLRVWIAGCSTGEETYSLAMLLSEAVAAARASVKLQIFASDADADAVATAREGVYPAAIEADVSPARLARFFAKEKRGYCVLPELRAMVVFAVQDVLADPPFSRIDLVSCRNLLIYLGARAQAKVMALFHFALCEGGILLLGKSETTGDPAGRFEVIAKAERLYRRIGRTRPGGLGGLAYAGAPHVRSPPPALPSRRAGLAELSQRLVIEGFAPAAVLITRRGEVLYAMGPTDRYLHVPPGPPTRDFLAMARPALRTKLRAAIHQSSQGAARIVVPGGQIGHGGARHGFNIHIQPTTNEGEELLLVSFVDEPPHGPAPEDHAARDDPPRVADLERELAAARTELQGAIRSLELSNAEQKAITEETLSINEEYQSTNEELLTSKEELQALNEELTALNGQLQETLERQRTSANDLQNILYSTDVGTLFLDTSLRIRFFTPAARSLFRVISSDIGRPLTDLTSLAADSALPADARAVLRRQLPIEREVEAGQGIWFIRRILPYRTHDGGVEGVVITFTDVTERKTAAEALQVAKQQAEFANGAKSRFLAMASHDLRQPLQTLTLLQGLLVRAIEGDAAKKLVARMDQTLGAMAGMLNTLLDINQIEAGTVHPQMATFPINDLLDRLKDEFQYHAHAKGLDLRVMPCSLSVYTDPRLLEQMVRNLLSNALKYTKRGRVLIGCRRQATTLRIDIWDTGIGIPANQLQAIFLDYHQLDNAARERSRGLGLGLAIVQRLGVLLGHPVSVRSLPDKGSVFAVDVPLSPGGPLAPADPLAGSQDGRPGEAPRATGTILVVEDDPELREALDAALRAEGHGTVTARDGATALAMVARGAIRPDLILADYNLPNGMTGVEVVAKLRERLHHEIPVVILTGDMSAGALLDIPQQNCVRLEKPVRLPALALAVHSLLAASMAAPYPAGPRPAPALPVIFVVDDDRHVRDGLSAALAGDGRTVEAFPNCEAFLAAYHPGREGCLLVDAHLPGMSGLELLHRLSDDGNPLPAIMITGHSDVQMAVQAMRAGATDFIEKPLDRDELLASVARALDLARDSTTRFARREAAVNHLAELTPRQREVMQRVVAGDASKNIAADLGISQRTVENHRASIMKRTGVRSVPALARLALTASAGDGVPPPDSAPAVRVRLEAE